MILSVLSALAEPTRIAAMSILWDGGEHCVCELMARLDASQSRMSRHMQTLKQAGLIVDRRDAQWVRYRVSPEIAPEIRDVVAAIMATTPKVQRNAA
jgi:ArsR family transcriptional regulator, arsenate/arsenite/antimonite-responsive transcriptional repressor